MSTEVILSIVVFLLLMFLKIPVFVTVMAGACVYLLLTPTVSGFVIVQQVIQGISSIPLLAIPFFVGAGVLMNMAGITKRIMALCVVMVGQMTGGLAQVNVLLSTLMGGLSGSNLADAAMTAKFLVPEMEEQGYSKEFSTVVTAVSSMITPIIPPGIGMIVYASLAHASVGRMFIAGIGVGIVLMSVMLVLNFFISKKRGYTSIRTSRPTAEEFMLAFRNAFFPLCLPLIIIGAIRFGIATPTEAGSIAVVYAIVLGFAYRTLTVKRLLEGLKETLTTTAAIMMIIGAVSTIAWVLLNERVPQNALNFFMETIDNRYVFLLVINLFLLVVGMFMEGNAAAVMLIPILAPIAAAYDIDLVHFGMIWVFNMSIGAITPPMGTLMYVTCGITGCTVRNFLKEAIPYYIMLLFSLILITYVPGISLWLVNLLW